MPEMPSSNDIREALHKAVHHTLIDDWDLLALGAHEQAIAHRVACYLEKEIPGFHIDCEYNRQKWLTKGFQGEWGQTQKSMRPDIIVHRRNTDTNVMAIEMKANDNNETSSDQKKLKELTAQEGGYQYKEAAFIEVKNGIAEISTGELEIIVRWYVFENNDLVEVESQVLKNPANHDAIKKIAALRVKEKE